MFIITPVLAGIGPMGAESRQFDSDIQSREVRIAPLGLAGTLNLPKGSRSLVIFAHGSGSRAFCDQVCSLHPHASTSSA